MANTTPADAPTSTAAPVRHAPEAERCHVRGMFCDLVDSTKRSQQLDAEDYRAVVCAYQEAAATQSQPWDGCVAGVYSWFTAGFDTADLQEAQALLHAIS